LLDRLEAQLRPESLLLGLGALLALTLLALHLYLLGPGVARYRELAARQAEVRLRDARAEAASTANATAALEAQLSTLRERLGAGGFALAAQEAESWIIDRLNDASLRHGVRLRSVDPAAPGGLLGFSELPFEVEAEGGFFALFAWLHAVETELRPLVVQRLELARAAETGHVRLSLRIAAYQPVGAES
jgi:Tfp pilus assembly protein PilO